MPAVDVQDCSFVKKGKVRIIIAGLPNSRKTTSFMSFPDPKIISGCPGEKNITILRSTPTCQVRAWEYAAGEGPRTTFAEYIAESKRILTNQVQQGTKCVIFDGMHKMQRLCTKAGKLEAGNGYTGWEKAKENYWTWMNMAYDSDIPLVIWSTWAVAEKIDQLNAEDPNKPAKKQYTVDLMGREQQDIMGEFPIIFQEVIGGKAYWQLQADDRVNCGLRVPPDQAKSLPFKIEAEWPKLAEVLSKFSVVGASMGEVKA